MNAELRRQLELLGLSESSVPGPEAWRAMLVAVDATYDAADTAHEALQKASRERSQELQRAATSDEGLQSNFEMLVESSPNAIFVSDGASAVLYANPRMAAMLGYEHPSELVGLLTDSFVPPEDRPVPASFEKPSSADAATGRSESRWMRRDGSTLIVSAATTSITYDDVPARITIANDITLQRQTTAERDAASAALRVSEERYRVLFDGAPLPVLVFDPETLRILTANRAACELYGYDPVEFSQLRISDLKVDPTDVELRAAQRPLVGKNPNRLWRGVKMHKKKDGTRVELDITSHDVTVSGRRAILCMASDITDKRHLEEQLRQSQKMEAIGSLAGGVAHDFNNILAVILADTDYVREELGDEHEMRPQLDEIAAAAERAAGLTHQLLAFSRRQIMKPRVLVLNVVVAELDRMLRRLIGEDIELALELEPVLGAVMADPGQLEQVMMNLIVNARDAMTSGGCITVRTRNVEVAEGDRDRPIDLVPGGYVTFTVSDTGSGMDEATAARIFEPFFTTKGIGRGTGLGLSTVFGIVQQSGGHIRVTSRPNEGATFCIWLPRVDQHTPAAAKSPTEARASRGEENVLLIEDDPHVRRAATRALRRRGYRVIEAGNGEEAIARFAERDAEIHLVVTDLVMPGLDGVAVASRLRQTHGPIHVLYMSGYSEHAALRDGALGASAPFLQKPFSSEELALAVRHVLDSGPPVARVVY